MLLAPASASAADPASAVVDYGSCLAARKSGDLLVLIDTSTSLHATDPAAARVDAAKYLLSRLSAFADQRKVKLDVALAGFADDMAVQQGWTPLGPGSVGDLQAKVDAFKTQNDGFDTDYWMALEQARRFLGDKAPPTTESKPCQAIAWFTDGALELKARVAKADQDKYGTTKPYPPPDGSPVLTDRDVAAAQDAASKDLCRPGGLADQLRDKGIVMFGVGLAAPGHVPADNFALMKGIVTGSPGQGTCGQNTSPRPGEYYPATDIDSLLQAFDQIPDPGIPNEQAVCQVDLPTCQTRHQFVLDSSVEDVHILGDAGVDGIAAQILLPDKTTVLKLDQRDGTPPPLVNGGTTIRYTWRTPRTIEIEMTRSDGAASWPGVWALAFVDTSGKSAGTTSRSSIKISSNLLPAILDKDKTRFLSGSTVPIKLGLVRSDDGSQVAASSLQGTVAVAAQLVGPDGKATTVAENLGKTALGEQGPPVNLNLTDVKPGTATLRVTLQLTTQPPADESIPGTALQPASVDVPITVGSPANYPNLEPPTVDFGRSNGGTSLTGTLTVVGPGCVWLDPAAPLALRTSPDGDPKVSVAATGATSGTGCLTVNDGDRKNLTLTLTTDRPANGTVSGTLPVSIAPIGHPDQAQPADVQFTADLRKPFQPLTFAYVLIAGLLLGPGIPLALLYLFKWLGARIPFRPLSARLIPVTISGGQVLRDGAPFGVTERDFVDLVRLDSGTRRKLPVGDGVVLRTRTGLAPLGAGFVTAGVPYSSGRPPYIGASSEQPPSHGSDLQGRLPLAVHNTWTVLHDPNGPADRAMVLMLVGADTLPDQRAQLAADAAGRVPEVLQRLREAAERRGLLSAPVPVGAGVGGPPGGPFGGPPGGYPGSPPFAPPTGPAGGGPFSPPTGPAGGGTFSPPGGSQGGGPWGQSPPGGSPFGPPPDGATSPVGGSPFNPPPSSPAPPPWPPRDGDDQTRPVRPNQ